MFAQQLVNGIVLGSTYALIALGYTMVYGIAELINFAHGEIYMFGAFIGLFMVTMFELPFLVALGIAMLAAAALGVAVEFFAYKPLRRSSRLAVLISAIGMSILLQNIALLRWGPQSRSFPRPFTVTTINLPLDIQISTLQIYILVISLVLMVGLHFLVTKTKVGKAMRATAQDKEAASLMGINVNRIISFTFAVGSALGAAAGVMVGIYFNSVTPTMGLLPGLKGFVAAVLGGIGNIPGAMLGGILLGVAETMGVAYGDSRYRDAIAFTILIVVLLFKPSGLLGKNIQDKV